jgi:hypothetical protein
VTVRKRLLLGLTIAAAIAAISGSALLALQNRSAKAEFCDHFLDGLQEVTANISEHRKLPISALVAATNYCASTYGKATYVRLSLERINSMNVGDAAIVLQHLVDELRSER